MAASAGVKVVFDTQVMNVVFDIAPDHKAAKRIEWIQKGQQGGIDLTEDDLVMMPFVTSFFLTRNGADRPKVVPDGVKNFAFIGQFAESTRDCIFTTEYSVRTAMEAVYQLLNIERGVPEVFGSIYDVRELIKSTAFLRDGKVLANTIVCQTLGGKDGYRTVA